jgi:hypothetical protein
MKEQQPPRVATWLARLLVSGARGESLIGDLVEQYSQGRSWGWYWRQVLAAIVVGAVHDIATHKGLALRALTIGWALYYLLAFPVAWAGGIAENWVGEHVIACEPVSFWCQFWRNQLSAELLILVACAVSGSIVARLNRKHWVAMLGLYAASVLLFEYGMIAWLVSRGPAPGPVSRGALLLANLTVLLRPLCIFVGGAWAVQSASPESRNFHAQAPMN